MSGKAPGKSRSRTADMYRRRRELGLCAGGCGRKSESYLCAVECQPKKSAAQAARRARRKTEAAGKSSI